MIPTPKHIARLTLLIMAAAVCFGLWQIPARRGTGTHVWPIHSHHFILLLLLLWGWAAIGLTLLAITAGCLWVLWKAAQLSTK